MNINSVNEHLDKTTTFGDAFIAAKTIFDGVSGQDRLALLKSLGGLYGHRVIPGTGTGPQGPALSRLTEGKVPKGPSQRKSQKSAKQIEIQADISRLNREISVESKKTGSRLPDSHVLIEERRRLFRALHERAGMGHATEGSAAQQGGLEGPEGTSDRA
jgi:hypothetical protein